MKEQLKILELIELKPFNLASQNLISTDIFLLNQNPQLKQIIDFYFKLMRLTHKFIHIICNNLIYDAYIGFRFK